MIIVISPSKRINHYLSFIMLPLNDDKWKKLEGGYKTPYDASIPLKKLKQAKNKEEINLVFTELWNELHHQGDVGLVSYYSVPHLINIIQDKKLYDFNAIGLVTTIEIQRHKDNPKLPQELEEEYLHSIQIKLPELIKQIIAYKWDETLTAIILAALAASKGHIEMADAILKMEDPDLLQEFLENY